MKRALVTGVSRGIGRAVSEMLLAEGWHVVGVSRSEPTLSARRFRSIRADVALPHQIDRLGNLGPLDAVIHCAGIRGPHGAFWEVAREEWLATIRTNLLGAYHVTRVTLPLLRRSEDGRILLFSGGGAFNPSPGYSAYAVAKAGVVSLMETLAAELAGTTVTVNCVAPGYVPTTIHEQPEDDGGAAMRTAVACVRHLLSPAAHGLTGKTVSAQWDDWESFSSLTVPAVNDSPMGTRYRQPIQRVREFARPRNVAAV